ncbi:hypothetical protein ACFLYT_00570 [Nanoarchaeota archaeon]
MMKKKAQGISMNVIIIAAIALIVMVVLIAIFTGRISKVQDEGAAAEDRAKANICGTVGICASECPDDYEVKDSPVGKWTDCTDTCCVKKG